MKTFSVESLPSRLTIREFLDSLDLSEGIVVTADGEACAVILSPCEYKQRQQAKAALFQTIDQIRQQNLGTDSDAILSELERDEALTVRGL